MFNFHRSSRMKLLINKTHKIDQKLDLGTCFIPDKCYLSIILETLETRKFFRRYRKEHWPEIG